MNLGGLMHEMAEAIRLLHQIGDTPVFVDDEGDVSQRVEEAVARTLRCVELRWNGCEHVASERPQSDDPNALVVQAEVVVSVYESPVDNRSYGGAPQLLGMAAAIAKEIDSLGTDDMDEGLHFVRITPIQQLQHGVITCDVVFRTKNVI